MMRKTSLALALLPLAAACTQGPPAETRLGAREAAQLEKALEGKVAGEPVSCISSYSPSNLRALGDNILVYRASRDLVYVNNLPSPCNGLARGDTLVLRRTSSSQYCRGDMAQVVHLPSGGYSGSCALGDFVPYRTAGK